MATAYQLVKPASPFTPLPYGLASVINWQDDPAVRWQGGVMWEPLCSAVTGTYSPCITGAPALDPPAKAETWDRALRGARPFHIYSEVDCAAPGWWELAMQDAINGFIQGESHYMEQVFQTGTVSNVANLIYPNLTATGPVVDTAALPDVLLQPASTIISGAPLDVVEGLGRLEQAFATCYKGTGVVHVPLQVAEEMQAQYLIVERNGLLYTRAGHRIAIGAGYDPGRGPGGVAAPAGAGWMWMTSPLWGYRTDVRPLGRERDMFDRAENTLKVITERTVLIGWDCCLVGVLVTLGGESAGTFGSAS